MSALELYNTLTRQKEPFVPVVKGRVGMYMCGPTVYSDPHLGHARGPIVFDVLRRWLEHEGYVVRLVTNITDVGHLTDDEAGEDKLVKRAKLERIEPMEVAEKYFWSYFDAMAALNVARPSIVPRASGHIGEQIQLVEQLIANGHAYVRGGNVYFDVSEFADYGRLSGRDPEDLIEGTRVEVRSDKDDPRDFALWKQAEPDHIMRWSSPWGPGFPGWHIECTVMSTRYLGEEFDIHGGGLDLVFPHHECELAQASAAGMPFARTWLHWNMITLRGEKMAKSKDHFVTLEDLFAQYEPISVRFHLLRSHYRSVSDFSEESLTASAQGLKRLRETYAAAQEVASRLPAGVEPGNAALETYRRAFADAMNDDLNTPRAVAALFDAAREVRRQLDNGGDPALAAGAVAFFDEHMAGVLGLPTRAKVDDEAAEALSGVVQLLLDERQKARERRDFEAADRLRDRLAELGIAVEDGAEGSSWKLVST